MKGMFQMATENDKPLTASEHLHARDLLNTNLSKASALAAIIGGEGFETFSSYNHEIQLTVIGTLHDLVFDAENALKIVNRGYAEGTV
jgi:hypothetical protein